MFKALFKFISIFVLISCSSGKTAMGEKKCDQIFETGFSEIIHTKYSTVVDKDTIDISEIRYQCVYGSMYSTKVMFDKFGKWDAVIYPNNDAHPFMLWKNVSLFEDDKLYNVYTKGLEAKNEIYTSFLVLDENENDLLDENSEEREKLTIYFADLLKNQDVNRREFYEIYWTTVDPEHWVQLKHAEYIKKERPSYRRTKKRKFY